MVNKYPGRCRYCGGNVPAQGGTLKRAGKVWLVAHLDCSKAKAPRVSTFNIGGRAYTRNSAGRCEDAPCCGCCTI